MLSPSNRTETVIGIKSADHACVQFKVGTTLQHVCSRDHRGSSSIESRMYQVLNTSDLESQQVGLSS